MASESALHHVAVERRHRWVLVVVIGVFAAAVGWFAFGHDWSSKAAQGRAGDACPARGPGGLVGIDVDTGEVRWTNVVGADEHSLSMEPGRAGRVAVRSQDGPVRTVRTSTGDVISCRKDQPFDPEPRVQATSVRYTRLEIAMADGWSVAGPSIDPEGAPVAQTVTVSRPDGTVAWTAEQRRLIGVSPSAVVLASAATGYVGLGGSIEVRDRDHGVVLWDDNVAGNDAAVTSSHVVAVDVDSRGDGPSTVSGYLISDGSLDWSVDVDSSTYPPYHLFAAGDRVYAPTDGEKRLVEIDPSQGRIRRTLDLPSPGMGGKWSEHGEVRGIVLDEATGRLVAAVTANQPYRD